MSDLTVTDPQTEFENPGERRSDVDGYTIVPREGRSPKVHLLRPWNECNTEKAKSGRDTVRIEGGREQLAEALARMGARRGDTCKRCFRYNPAEDLVTPVVEFEDEDVAETLDKYQPK